MKKICFLLLLIPSFAWAAGFAGNGGAAVSGLELSGQNHGTQSFLQ